MFPAIALNAASLLRHFREIVALKGLSTQDKIHKVMKLLCNKLGVDVSSVYCLRGLVSLELLSIATSPHYQGQHPKLISRESIWGEIIDGEGPLVLSDMSTHPKFTGQWEEEMLPLHGLLGVPISRGGTALGLLAVQTQDKRTFSADDVELMLTLAMILAEMIAADTDMQLRLKENEGTPLTSYSFQGHTLASGTAVGYAFLHHDILDVKNVLAEDVSVELQLLFDSIHAVHEELAQLQKELQATQVHESMEIFESYRMFAQDRGWLGQIQSTIERGLTAEAAVLQTIQKIRERIFASKDPYFRDKLSDFEDLSRRLLRKLQKRPLPQANHANGIIVFAEYLGPAELLEYQRFGLKGVVLQEDMALAHVGVVARALEIPVLSGVKSILPQVQWADVVVLNADKGEVLLNPAEEVVKALEKRLKTDHQHSSQLIKLRQLPAVTKDGHLINLSLNAGAHFDLKRLFDVSIQGIGLYRTEIPFMMYKAFPTSLSQESLYRDVYKEMGDLPIVFRTLDVGGDKLLPYQKRSYEENPAMGWRAIRISLDRPSFLKEQLRAIIRASEGRSLHVMFPLIANVQEFLKAKEIFQKELERELSKGLLPPLSTAVGAMVEVPSIVWTLDELLLHVDFISVGTNDLCQFFYAVDRSNSHLNGRYDVLSKPFLDLLSHIAKRAAAHHKPASICGEMASNPLEAMALLAIGYTILSINPGSLADVKMMIRSLDLRRTQSFLEDIMGRNSFTIRQELSSFAHDHDIPIRC